jgi:hypothetical protein
MPCQECGASLDRADFTGHACPPERWVDYQMFGLRDEVAQLETELRRFLETPAGHFESWDAARQVRGQT